MARLPTKKRWRGIFRGEILGDFISAYNLDLQRNVGTLHISEKLQEVFNSTDDADLGSPSGFIKSNADNTDRFWVIAGAVLFKSDADDSEAGWVQDAIASSPTDCNDGMIEYVGDMYVPTTTDMDKLSGGTWTNPWWSAQTGASALISGEYHTPWVSPVGDLLIPDGRFINSWDGSSATDPKITLAEQFQITGGLTEGDFSIIITKTNNSTEAKVFHWNGTDSLVNFEYGSGSKEIVGVFSFQGIPYIVTKEGEIKIFTGSGYKTVQEFPTYAAGNILNSVFFTGPLEGKIGLSCLSDGSVSSAGQVAKGFDGIWMFDPITLDLYPRYSLNTESVSVFAEPGQMHLLTPGAFLETTVTGGRIITGGKLYTNYTSTTQVILNSSMEGNTSGAKGRFVIRRIETSNVRDLFRRIILIIKKLESSTDKILVKYKRQTDVFLPVTRSITWVNATSFTVSTAANLSVGDEVEILAGPNAGSTAHIITISGTTITIDTTLNSSTNGGLARFDDWILLKTITSQVIQREILNVRKKSSFILFKFELIGTETSPEIQTLQIDHEPKTY